MGTDFAYIAMEGYGGESFRLEATLASRKIHVQRREAAQPGGLIGLFESTASAGSIEKLLELAQGLPRKPASAMRPDSATAVILLAGGATSWTLPRPSAEWDAHLPLRAEVLRLVGDAEKSPLRALRVRLTAASSSEIAVELSNPGSTPVELDWKKIRLKAEGFLEMSKLPPNPKGPAPLPPANLTVGQYSASPASPKRLEPRGRVALQMAVQFPKPGNWKLQARYECLSLPDGSSGIEGRATSGAPVPVSR